MGPVRRSPAPLITVVVVLAVAALLWRLGSQQTRLEEATGAPPAAVQSRAAGAPGREGLPTPPSLVWRVAARVDPPEVVTGDLVTVTGVAPAAAEAVVVRLPGETAWRPMEQSGDTWNGDYRLWEVSVSRGGISTRHRPRPGTRHRQRPDQRGRRHPDRQVRRGRRRGCPASGGTTRGRAAARPPAGGCGGQAGRAGAGARGGQAGRTGVSGWA